MIILAQKFSPEGITSLKSKNGLELIRLNNCEIDKFDAVHRLTDGMLS